MNKRLLVMILALMAASTIVGCGRSLARTADERAHQADAVLKSDLEMANDDIDVFLLSDRRSRLTRWH